MGYFGSAEFSKKFALAGSYVPANKTAKNDSEVTGNTDIAAFSAQADVAVASCNLPEMGALWKKLRMILSTKL
jgi:maltose-binding protein MalE